MIAETLINMTRTLSGLVFALAVLGVIFSGFRYITSAGDPRQSESAKLGIVFSAVGMFLAVFALGFSSLTFFDSTGTGSKENAQTPGDKLLQEAGYGVAQEEKKSSLADRKDKEKIKMLVASSKVLLYEETDIAEQYYCEVIDSSTEISYFSEILEKKEADVVCDRYQDGATAQMEFIKESGKFYIAH